MSWVPVFPQAIAASVYAVVTLRFLELLNRSKFTNIYFDGTFIVLSTLIIIFTYMHIMYDLVSKNKTEEASQQTNVDAVSGDEEEEEEEDDDDDAIENDEEENDGEETDIIDNEYDGDETDIIENEAEDDGEKTVIIEDEIVDENDHSFGPSDSGSAEDENEFIHVEQVVESDDNPQNETQEKKKKKRRRRKHRQLQTP